ncbi:GGDEF domain-containing response regulator [Opitutaceae bacterium]|nr:GGDEF domain-containing response regulator [Opitutaceae bacterium]
MNPRRLLLIDDDRLQSRLVEQQLKAFRHERFQMEWQETFEVGLERLLSGEHEVCLLDYKLGPRDGLELIRLAKEAGCEVPIIFLTAESSSDIDIEAMNAGALDYLVKGEISPSNLERSLRYALKLADTLAELKRLATRDALTGLLNRRELNRIMAEETERSVRFGRPFSLVMLDLDHFKSVNDTHGHAAGDLVLQEASLRAQACLRPTDRIARFGGEEFAVLLIELDEEAASEVAERIVKKMRETSFDIGDGTAITVTVSAGLATLPRVAQTSDELMAAADKALYVAKASGRDRMQIASVQV